MTNLQKLLKITPDKVKAVNSVFLDPDSQVMKNFFEVVAKYGTPEEINRKHKQARKWKISTRSWRSETPPPSRI